jgi:uncharacterized DUF497 family protein
LETRFTWDPEKAKANARKHSVSFEMAAEVFRDPHSITIDNDFVEGEQREQVIGMTRGIALVSVIFVDRSEPGVEITRIISARKATTHERSAYNDQFR